MQYRVLLRIRASPTRIGFLEPGEVQTEMANRLVQGGLAPGDATIEFLCEGNCFAANRTQGDPIEARVSYPHTFHLLGPIANYLGGDGSAYGSVTIRTGIVMSVE